MHVMMRPRQRQVISRSRDREPILIDGKEHHRTWILMHDETDTKRRDEPIAYACYVEGVDDPAVIAAVEQKMMLLCAKINEVFPEEG